MRHILKKLPFLGKLVSWAWQIINLRTTVTQLVETRGRVEDLIKYIGALHHEVNVLKHELAVMKQDLSVLRQENEDLRGLGVLVPQVEAHDEALERLERELADHRDASHKIQDRLIRQFASPRTVS